MSIATFHRFPKQMPLSRWDLRGDPGDPFLKDFQGYLRGRLEAIFVAFWRHLGPCWSYLGGSWRHLGNRFPKQMPLSRFNLRGDPGDPGDPFLKDFQGYLRGRFETILVAFWRHLGPCWSLVLLLAAAPGCCSWLLFWPASGCCCTWIAVGLLLHLACCWLLAACYSWLATAPGFCWLLLAATDGCCSAAPGWLLLLAAPGFCSWSAPGCCCLLLLAGYCF